jgi:hypothetical protein
MSVGRGERRGDPDPDPDPDSDSDSDSDSKGGEEWGKLVGREWGGEMPETGLGLAIGEMAC